MSTEFGYLDLGSNLERERSVREGLKHLRQVFGPLRTSAIYETAPVGITDQPNFYNLSIEIKTELEPEAIRAELRAIEDAMGRDRSGPKYGPRNIDLDLILLGARVERGPDWSLPHPQLLEQAFVLVPLLELLPQGLHPENGRPLRELAANLDQSGLVRLERPREVL